MEKIASSLLSTYLLAGSTVQLTSSKCKRADAAKFNLNLKSLTRTKSTSEKQGLESAGALASRDAADGTVSPKDDNEADERADIEGISEGNNNEKEISETVERLQNITALDEKTEPLSHGDS